MALGFQNPSQNILKMISGSYALAIIEFSISFTGITLTFCCIIFARSRKKHRGAKLIKQKTNATDSWHEKGNDLMKTWNDYKEYVSALDPELRADVEEVTELAAFVTLIIQRRNELGLSQRDLASLSGLPQSTIARFETMQTTPNIETILKLLKPLGLQLSLLSVSA